VKGLQEGLVRNLIQLFDRLPLDIDHAGCSQNIDEPCTSEILRNEFPNQSDLSQKTSKLLCHSRMGRLFLGDKSA